MSAWAIVSVVILLLPSFGLAEDVGTTVASLNDPQAECQYYERCVSESITTVHNMNKALTSAEQALAAGDQATARKLFGEAKTSGDRFFTEQEKRCTSIQKAIETKHGALPSCIRDIDNRMIEQSQDLKDARLLERFATLQKALTAKKE